MAESKVKDGKKESLFSQYQTLMTKYPLHMNAVQAGIISALSVIASQYLSYLTNTTSSSSNNLFFVSFIQWREVFVMLIIGSSYVTPILLIFYYFLNKMTFGGNLGKLFIDQILFSPIFTASIIAYRFFLLDSTLSGQEIINRTIMIAPTAITSAWSFWIPQRYFTLNYIPPVYQLVFGNICSFLWNIIFSLIMASSK